MASEGVGFRDVVGFKGVVTYEGNEGEQEVRRLGFQPNSVVIREMNREIMASETIVNFDNDGFTSHYSFQNDGFVSNNNYSWNFENNPWTWDIVKEPKKYNRNGNNKK